MPEVNEALQSVPWHQLSNAVDRLLDGAVPQLRGRARVRLIGNYLAEMRRRTRAGAFNKRPARESDAELRGAELKAARARPYPPGYGLHTHVATVCTLACTQDVHRGGGPAPGMSGAGADDRGGAASAGDFGAEETTAVTAGAFVEVGSPIGELTVSEAGPMPTHSWERLEARPTRGMLTAARAAAWIAHGSRYHFEQSEPPPVRLPAAWAEPMYQLPDDFAARVMAAVAEPAAAAPPLYAHGPSSVAKYHEWTEAGGKSAPNCKTCGGPCRLWNGGGQP